MNQKNTLIIAEAGVNHNGKLHLAKKLVDIASEAGADIVKFQTFKASKLASPIASQADYQIRNTGKSESQLEMLRKLELSESEYFELFSYCKEKEIQFLSTAFDEHSLDFLVNKLGQKLLKIPSGEITNTPLLVAHASKGLPIILSTGMATLAEIQRALSALAFGYLEKTAIPSNEEFDKSLFSNEGQVFLKENVKILHCTTDYPTPIEDINLRAMQTIENAFKLEVGLSDHSEGILAPIIAVAMGAKIIEKHFTIDRNMEGPDHKASLEPKNLTKMISQIRSVETIKGDGIKTPRKSEIKNRLIARRSIIAETNIKKGEKYTKSNISIKRPGNGLSPNLYWSLIGQESNQDYKPGELIKS